MHLQLELKNFKVKLGEYYQGGIIVKLPDNGMPGLICTKNDLPRSVSNTFMYGGYIVFENSLDMDDGLKNTKGLEGITGDSYAVAACVNLSIDGYSDWYLPAFNELILIDSFRDELGFFGQVNKMYWSSTNHPTNVKFAYVFSLGATPGGNLYDKKEYLYVRAFRKF